MKVLLLSPLAGIDPACGDVTYTQSLLASPPEGVEYETYAEALSKGTLVERARRSRWRNEPFLYAGHKAVNQLRRWRWMFWEPFRFFEVAPDAYDLIHCHLFACHFSGSETPVVVGGGSPQRDLYLDARHQSGERVRFEEVLESVSARWFGVNSYSYHLPGVSRLLTYSTYARDYFVEQGAIDSSRIDIIPIFMKDSPQLQPSETPHRIGFVAKDFDAKGGNTLLDAFAIVRVLRPDAHLDIVGCEPRLNEADAAARGITWLPYIPREKLLAEMYPNWDVFAYPTGFDCISYVLLEAMSHGLAIVTSDYPSMPEAVAYGKAGLVSPVGKYLEPAGAANEPPLSPSRI
jgi:glycosyltransferase involved in cell wall biosynthesis